MFIKIWKYNLHSVRRSSPAETGHIHVLPPIKIEMQLFPAENHLAKVQEVFSTIKAGKSVTAESGL